MTDRRPTSLTPQMKLVAARKIAQEIIDAGIDLTSVEEASADIARRGSLYSDGYELARDLENWHHWCPNFEMCEILDGYSAACREQLETAEKEWHSNVNMQPPLPIGTRVRLIGRTETGEITGIYEYGPAKFLIAIDNDPAPAAHNSRRIVNFESVEAIEP